MAGSIEEDLKPPLSPRLKRKRGDSTASVTNAQRAVHAGATDQQSPRQSLASSGDSGTDSQIDQDMLDELVEQLQCSAGRSDVLNLMQKYSAADANANIKEMGQVEFTKEVLAGLGMEARDVGNSFSVPTDFLPDDDDYMVLLSGLIAKHLTKRRKLAKYNTIDDAAKLLLKSKNIMIITGAGISTSLGIPDFRSKHTGFYSRLQEMGFTEPEEVFDIEIFDESPEIFYSLAGDILPKGNEYTPTHGFIRLVQDQGCLQTNYTQNIDNLEGIAGIDPAKVIQCHGSFATASCRKCGHRVAGEEIFDDIRAKRVSQCKRCILNLAERAEQPAKKPVKHKRPKFAHYEDSDSEDAAYDIPTPGVMKPDITFFGERLPEDFFQRFQNHDRHIADLVIVIGTSLQVAPVGDMPDNLPPHVPHIYISREPCHHIEFDIQLLGDCDTVVWELCERAGWKLTHEMIPADLKVEIEPLEPPEPSDDSPSRWTVRAQKSGPVTGHVESQESA